TLVVWRHETVTLDGIKPLYGPVDFERFLRCSRCSLRPIGLFIRHWALIFMVMTKFLTRSAAEYQARSVLFALWLTALVSCVEAPQPGAVLDVATGHLVAPEAVMLALADADYVLLGEQHDNPAHHELEAEIVRRLIAAGRRPALVMEMLDA